MLRWVIRAAAANRYKNKLQNSFQHGGISLEEMLIPVLKMKGISK